MKFIIWFSCLLVESTESRWQYCLRDCKSFLFFILPVSFQTFFNFFAGRMILNLCQIGNSMILNYISPRTQVTSIQSMCGWLPMLLQISLHFRWYWAVKFVKHNITSATKGCISLASLMRSMYCWSSMLLQSSLLLQLQYNFPVNLNVCKLIERENQIGRAKVRISPASIKRSMCCWPSMLSQSSLLLHLQCNCAGNWLCQLTVRIR